jgi:ech hydrogenase subunit D
MSERDMHEMEEITADGLLAAADALLLDGWRMVQMLALVNETGFELNYSFGGGYAMKTLRLKIGAKDPVPSITSYYPAATLYENEMRDLFGVRIERIHPDWHGDLMGGKKKKPFSRARVEGTSVERPVPLNAPASRLPDGAAGGAPANQEGGSR